MIELSPAAARSMLLAAQGLLVPPRRRATKQDVLAAIRQMHALQIDTIHVVARSPYLVLWSRLGDYEPRWLDELLAEGELFEYWSHEACLLPIEDYPLYLVRMSGPRAVKSGLHRRLAANRAAADELLATIRAKGPVRSADFARQNGSSNGWWDWKPEKMLLESLLTAGELMIARRERFQRIYDLRERVLPDWHRLPVVSVERMREEFALRAVRALGITQAGWVADYFRLPKTGMPEALEALAERGQLLRVSVEGWDAPTYLHPDHAALAQAAATGDLRPTRTTLLSPFDPVVWDRARARAMFGFDYTIECYTPAPKRKYGYFTLPILRRGQLIGRLDPKAHRQTGVFEIRAIHLEPGVRRSDRLAADVAKAIRDCARWHQTPEIVVRASDPPELASRLTAMLRTRSGVMRVDSSIGPSPGPPGNEFPGSMTEVG